MFYEKNSRIDPVNCICALRNYDLDRDALEEFKMLGINLKPSEKITTIRFMQMIRQDWLDTIMEHLIF